MTITDKNRVIAEFEGFKETGYSYKLDNREYFSTSEFLYHESLDWLWPVWCKFREFEV